MPEEILITELPFESRWETYESTKRRGLLDTDEFKAIDVESLTFRGRMRKRLRKLLRR
jgi:hypothetical protein